MALPAQHPIAPRETARVPATSGRQKSAHEATCSCDHRAPPVRVIRDVEFSRDMAQRLCALNKSGDATIDLLLSELLDHRTGDLFAPDGGRLPLDSSSPDDVAWFDNVLPEDTRRTINRFKTRAVGQAGTYRLQTRQIDMVMLVFLALEIRDCRMSGKCSRTSARG